ncbi:hypothetical protein TRVL_09674 [Trypanosoma vivax]|nr:hypothetical protein TRVL_09674 [Trypanosoma vivax]
MAGQFGDWNRRSGKSSITPFAPLPARTTHLLDIQVPKLIVSINPIGDRIDRGDVAPGAVATLFLQSPIEQRILAHQRLRMWRAFLQHIRFGVIVVAIANVFAHHFGRNTERR